MARVVCETMSGEREYADRRAIGRCVTPRIIFRHILPHLLPTLIVARAGIATTSLFEAVLSYLGTSAYSRRHRAGAMVNENQTYFESAPWLEVLPSLAHQLLALAFNLPDPGDAGDRPPLQGRH